MKISREKIGIIGGVMSFLFCTIAGLWILITSGLDPDDALYSGIGLYFIGKGIFVGTTLILMSKTSYVQIETNYEDL